MYTYRPLYYPFLMVLTKVALIYLLENVPTKKVLKTEKVFCHIHCYCAQNFYLMTLVHNPSANFQNLMVQSSEPLIQYCSLCDRIMHLTLLLWPNLDKFNFRIHIRIFFGESDSLRQWNLPENNLSNFFDGIWYIAMSRRPYEHRICWLLRSGAIRLAPSTQSNEATRGK